MQVLRRRAAVLAAVVGLAVAAAPALASTQPAAGTFVEGPEFITDEQQADGNLIFELTRAVVFTGTYTGVGQAHQRIVIHKDGSAQAHMTITFTGVACGQPATLVFLVEGQVQFDQEFTGPISSTYTVIDAGQTDSRTLRGHASSRAWRGSAECTRVTRTATKESCRARLRQSGTWGTAPSVFVSLSLQRC
jgi:hypothetical protein